MLKKLNKKGIFIYAINKVQSYSHIKLINFKTMTIFFKRQKLA